MKWGCTYTLQSAGKQSEAESVSVCTQCELAHQEQICEAAPKVVGWIARCLTVLGATWSSASAEAKSASRPPTITCDDI